MFFETEANDFFLKSSFAMGMIGGISLLIGVGIDRYHEYEEEKKKMIIVNTDHVPGYKVIKVHGLVKGNIVQAKHIGKDIVAGLRTIVGGEIKEYTEMLTEARQKATYLMVQEAEGMGANAILNLRYMTSQIMQNASEILAYGTAVTIEEEN